MAERFPSAVSEVEHGQVLDNIYFHTRKPCPSVDRRFAGYALSATNFPKAIGKNLDEFMQDVINTIILCVTVSQDHNFNLEKRKYEDKTFIFTRIYRTHHS